MKPSSLCLSLASVMILSGAVRADIVVMKDGKKYESATILSETADSVTFKYMLTPRIPDTRTEPKANVAQIIKQRPEELAVVPLRKLVPSEDLLSADQYEGIIQDKLRPFVSQYPGTAEAKEVEGMIATLQAEKEKVVSGQAKVEGEWVSADVVKRDGHNIDAYRVRRAMNEAAAKGEWVDALKEWDKLNAREDGYSDTEHFVKAVPEALKALENYKKELDKMLAEQPILQKRRDDSLKTLVEPDLSRTKKAIDAEMAQYKTTNEMERKLRSHWLTPYKYDAKSIQAAAKAVVEEQAKLTALDLVKIKASNEALSAARRYLADQNIEQAEAAIARAIEANGRSSSSAVTKLRAAVTALKAELNRKRANQKIYGNASALSSGSSSGTDDRVAKAMEDAAKEKAEKKEAKEGASSGKGLTMGSKSGVSHSSRDEAADTPKKKKSRSSAADADEESATSDGGIQKYLIYGGAALLVVLLAAMFLQKRPKK